jgi:hypothetical protein
MGGDANIAERAEICRSITRIFEVIPEKILKTT